MKYPETAKRLNKILREYASNAADLSRRSGVSKASISQYINGKNTPSNINAYKLGKALHVSPAWLMGFDVDDIWMSPTDFESYTYPNSRIDGGSEQVINQEALELYYKYLSADKKTRKMIDILLNGDDEDEN